MRDEDRRRFDWECREDGEPSQVPCDSVGCPCHASWRLEGESESDELTSLCDEHLEHLKERNPPSASRFVRIAQRETPS